MLRDLLERDRTTLAGEIVHRIKGVGETFAETAGAKRTPTPLNGRNGPHRAIDWMMVPLDRIKAASKAMECTVNDVVLAAMTAGWRTYLQHRGDPLDALRGGHALLFSNPARLELGQLPAVLAP